MLQQERLASMSSARSLLPPSGAMLSRDAVVVVDGLFPPTQIAQMEHTLIDSCSTACATKGTMVAELPSGSAVLPPYPQGEASDAAKSAGRRVDAGVARRRRRRPRPAVGARSPAPTTISCAARTRACAAAATTYRGAARRGR